MKTNYAEKLWVMRGEIHADVRELVKAQGGQINVPYFYDEDDMDDDIETLIEDGYNVQVGSPYANLRVGLMNYCGYRIETEIVALTINKYNNVEIVTSKSEIYQFTDIENIQVMAMVYKELIKLCEK